MTPQRNPTTEPNALEIRSPKGNVHPKPVDILVDEVAPLESQVMDVISQLVSALDCYRVARQPTEVTGCSLKDFYSHLSVSFDGRGDHINVENLLNDIEELLATTGCTNEQKVAYTTYKLTREASASGRTRRRCLLLTRVRRFPFFGMSSNMSSISISFPELCRR